MRLIFSPWWLTVLFIIVLAGCATSERGPVEAPPIQVSAETWKKIDCDIAAESRAAIEPVARYARSQMEHWRLLATQRGESDFIPWYTSYWTQQWLTTKVAWYRLSQGDDGEPPVDRLASYLQAQYLERVLTPVAEEVDPKRVVGEVTKRYVQNLASQLPPISTRYGMPGHQFRQHLDTIPAITLGPPPANDAALGAILDVAEDANLPAYQALIHHYSEAGGVAFAGLSKKRISPVARRVSEKLVDRVAVSGGTSAISALLGGVAGSVFSLGAAGVGMIIHESGREELENQVRTTLNASMDDMWQILVEDHKTAVTAGVYDLYAHIEQICPPVFAQAIPMARPPEEVPLPDLPPVSSERDVDALPAADIENKE